MRYQIAPIPDSFLRRVREHGTDDQEQLVRRMRSAHGGEPCRDVLRRARPGEEVILASFSPFSRRGPFKEFGPVYVLARPSSKAVVRDALPLSRDDDYFKEQLVLRAYDEEETIVDASLATMESATEILDQFLSRDDVAFVDARFPTYGCFACRINRSPATEDGK